MAKDRIDDNAEIDNMDDKDLDQYGVWVSPENQDTADIGGLSSDLLDVEEDMGSDDLGDLNDLLLSIDEENDNDETIYLEEDDMSLDLDADANSMINDQNDSRQTPPENDDIGDFQIPSLDNEEITLSIEDEDDLIIPDMNSSEEDEISFDLDSADPLEIEETTLNSLDGPEEDSLGDLGRGLDSLSMDEMGIDDSLPPPPNDDFVDISLDDDSTLSEGLDLEVEDDTSELVLDAMDDDTQEFIMDDLALSSNSSLDLPESETVILDNSPFESDEIILEDQSNSLDIADFSSGDNPMDIPEESFDDLAALQEDLYDKNTSNIELAEEIADEPVLVSAPRQTASQAVTPGPANSILSSIEKELFAIRNELTDLRSELKRLRGRENQSSEQGQDFDNDIIENDDIANEQVIDDTDMSLGFDASVEQPKGFFEDDEDETIALTGDELDNILNSAEFTEEAGQPSQVEEQEVPEPMEILLEPETIIKDQTESDISFEDDFNDDSLAPIEEITLEEINSEKTDSSMSMDDSLLDDLGIDSTENSETVFDGGDPEVESMANLDIEKELAGIEDLSDGSSDLELFTESNLADMELDIQDLHTASLNAQTEEVIEEISLDEIQEQNPEPVLTSTTPDIAPKSKAPNAPNLTNDVPYNIKQEIKAVLQYMDQLLDALPQEKIADFAKSEHFDTYKKLFEELGI